ncbi:MAG: TolC family protein [Candidatus Magnetominusculus sp. LBB02]|nr:TolC family protein [Candidatus Magnetominusculus sp. LBB02]
MRFFHRKRLSLAAVLVFVAAAAVLADERPPGSAEAAITISEGIAIATAESRVMKIASANINISEKESDVAMSILLPSINAEIAQGFLNNKPMAIFGTMRVPMANRNSLSYGVNIKQSLYDFGANIARYRASLESQEAAKVDYERIKNLTALEFLIGCYEVLEYDKLIEVSLKEIERFDAHHKVALELYKEGVITKNDLLQAEVRLSDSRQRLAALRNSRKVSASRLNNLLQRPLMADLRIAEPDGAVASSDNAEIEYFIEMAQKQRPEIKIVGHELEILTLQQRMRASEYLPTFYAQAGYNYTENDYQVYEGSWSVMLGARMNIFNGGSTRAELSNLKIKKERLSEQMRKLSDDIALDVERYYLSMKSAVEKLSVMKDTVSQSEENLRINKARYQNGQGTATDVVDAITLSTAAQTNYYSAIYEQQRAYAGLLYACGSDLKEMFK